MIININEMSKKMTPDAFFRYVLLVGPSIESLTVEVDVHNHNGLLQNTFKKSLGFRGHTKLNILVLLWCYALAVDGEGKWVMYNSHPFLRDPNNKNDALLLRSDLIVDYQTYADLIRGVYGHETANDILNLTQKITSEVLKNTHVHPLATNQ